MKDSIALPVLVAAMFAAACSNSVAPRGDSSGLVGVWDWTEHFDDAANSATCDDTGSYVFALGGAGFAGRSDQVGACASPSGPFDNTSSDTVINGSVSGGRIQFSVGVAADCQYTAVLSADTNHLAGTATCGTAAGQWSADRGLALGAVAVAPESTAVPPYAVFRLIPVLRNTLGNRVFDRAVSWASDGPGVAAVDSLGMVSAGQPGTAHIQASATGLAGLAAITVGGTTVPDAVGDTYGDPTDPAIDILALSAASDSSDVTVVVQLTHPLATTLYGWLDLDVDQDSTTGAEAQVDVFRPDTTVSSGLGDEFVCDLSSGNLYDAVSGNQIAIVPLHYDGATGTLTTRLPVALLGSLRANMAVVLGNGLGPTDIVPDDGHLTLGGPAGSAGTLGSAAIRRFPLPWRGTVGSNAPTRPRRVKIPWGR